MMEYYRRPIIIFLLLFLVFYISPCKGEDLVEVIKKAKETAVTIVTEIKVINKADGKERPSIPVVSCSGILISKEDQNFALTVAHPFIIPNTVVAIRSVIDTFGDYTTHPETSVVQVTKDPSFKDIKEKVLTVPLIVDHENDCAVLLLKRKITDVKITFEDRVLNPGETVYAVSSPFGIDGHDTITTGVVSYINRESFSEDNQKEDVLDELSLIANSGSSGGGVFLQDRSYVGLLKGIGFFDGEKYPLVSYMIPTRDIKKWLESNGMLWLINDDPIPKDFLTIHHVK